MKHFLTFFLIICLLVLNLKCKNDSGTDNSSITKPSIEIPKDSLDTPQDSLTVPKDTIQTKFEFVFPLSVGKTWTYSFRSSRTEGYVGTNRPLTDIKGIRIWEIKSKNVYLDSTVYQVVSTQCDTITERTEGTTDPPVIKFSKTEVPFTIVAVKDFYNVNYPFFVNLPYLPSRGKISCPRWLDNDTTTIIKVGNVTFLNGEGFYNLSDGYRGNTRGYYEITTLIR